MGGWQRETMPEERTLMFDIATLSGQTQRADVKARGEGGTRTINVPMLPIDPTTLANVVAAELNIQTHVKQELLEMPSALSRLQREAEILAEETPQLGQRLRIQHRRRYTGFGTTS
jgi:hypothetical protein